MWREGREEEKEKEWETQRVSLFATLNFCDLALGFRKKEGRRETPATKKEQPSKRSEDGQKSRESGYTYFRKKEKSTMGRNQRTSTTTRFLLLLGGLCLVLILLLALLLWWLKNKLRCTSIDTVSSSLPRLSFERKRGKLQLCALGDFRDTGKEDLRKQHPRSYGKLAKVAMVPK